MPKTKKKKQEVAVEAPKPVRPLDQIQKEYLDVCQQIGDRSYRKVVLEAEIAQLIQRGFQLNQEASQVQAAPQPTPQPFK